MTQDFDARVKSVAAALDKWLPDAGRAAVVTENIAANILLAADLGERPTLAALDALAERRRQIEDPGARITKEGRDESDDPIGYAWDEA